MPTITARPVKISGVAFSSVRLMASWLPTAPCSRAL